MFDKQENIVQLIYLPGNNEQSLIVNCISMYKRFAGPRSMNGDQSQLLTL